MEPPELVKEAEEAEGRKGEPASGRGGRERALSRHGDDIVIAVLKKGKM